MNKISTIDPFKMQNFFTKDEFKYIYDEIVGKEDQFIRHGNGVSQYFLKDENILIESIAKKMKDAMGEEMLVSTGFYARYDLIDGVQPKLNPHHDTSSIENHTFTMSVELKSSLDWDICVNENRYALSENEAVIFSGTGQLHYRPDIEFKANDFYDIFVCHFIPKSFRELLPDGHQEAMKDKARMLYNRIYDK